MRSSQSPREMYGMQHKTSDFSSNQAQKERTSKFKLTLPNYELLQRMDSYVEPLLLSCNRFSIEEKFNSEIQVAPFIAWILLFANILSGALVPCWLMADVHAESLTRNSWRFTILSTLIIPFVLYEYRSLTRSGVNFRSCFTIQNLKIIFICSINQCVWVCILIYSCKFTSWVHVNCLVSLRFFIIAIRKFKKSDQYHEFEIGGIILVVIGIVCLLIDSLTLEITPFPPPGFQDNQRYLHFSHASRVFGDLLAFSASIVSAYLNQQYEIPKTPLFANFFIFNFFLAFNFVSFGYFFGGSNFSMDIKSGVFGLFCSQNFVSIFYVSIMLGLNLMISRIMVDQMFSSLIINISGTIQMLITSFLYHLLGFEITHSGYSSLGIGFMVPGMIFIIAGQNLLQDNRFSVDYVIYRPPSQPDISPLLLESPELKPIKINSFEEDLSSHHISTLKINSSQQDHSSHQKSTLKQSIIKMQ